MEVFFFGEEAIAETPEKMITHLPVTNPFYNIVHNEKYYPILKLLGKGLISKEIAPFVGIESGTVDTYIKHMIQEVNCKNRVEFVCKAKDARVI